MSATERALGPAPHPSGAGPLIGVIAFLAAVHGAWWWASGFGLTADRLADGDSYAWLARAGRLLETGAWYDTSFPRANAPFGGSLHWTRLMDVVLIALAAPLLPIVSAKSALAWAGFLVGPLLHLATAMALIWAARPILTRRAAYLAGAMTAVQLGFMGYATVGHADHHLLIGLWAVLAMGFFFRALLPERNQLPKAVTTGVCLSLGLWVGPEILVLICLMTLTGALAWLAGEVQGARFNVLLTGGLTAGLGAVLLIERGFDGFWVVEYDRVSIVYLLFAGLQFVFWAMVGAAQRFQLQVPSMTTRLILGAVGVTGLIAVMLAVFPQVVAGPLGGVDPAFFALLDQIAEFRPLSGPSDFLIFLGSALFALPWLAWRYWSDPRRSVGWIWLFISLATISYVFLSFIWLRWSLYAGPLLALALGGVLDAADGTITAKFSGVRRSLVLVAVISLLAVGPAGLGLAGRAADGRPARGTVCDLGAMARHLNGPPWNAPSRTILASANFGPEILYRTPHKVLATLHHRNASGMLDGIRILGGNDDDRIRSLARARGVELILLCPGSGADGIFLEQARTGSLYERLAANAPPEWLRPVPLPGKLGVMFRLYQVYGD